MFCAKCGTNIEVTAKFCRVCGAQVVVNQPVLYNTQLDSTPLIPRENPPLNPRSLSSGKRMRTVIIVTAVSIIVLLAVLASTGAFSQLSGGGYITPTPYLAVMESVDPPEQFYTPEPITPPIPTPDTPTPDIPTSATPALPEQLPPPPPPIHNAQGSLLEQLSSLILNTNNQIQLTITWIGGSYDGTTSVYDRGITIDDWYQYGRSGDNRETFPTFSPLYENDDLTALIMDFYLENQGCYYLYDDGKGVYLPVNGSEVWDCTWEITIPSESTLKHNTDDFILPFSSSRELTDDDLRDLTAEQLRIARNEIYARHGRLFHDISLQEYFDGKEWYAKLDKLPLGTEPDLTSLEKSNISLIRSYED